MPRHTAADALRGPVVAEEKIQIPFGFFPRSYQHAAMMAMDNGMKRAMTVWHRRSGKDIFWLNQMLKHMVLAPFCGTYLYIFPHLTQGRRDLWDAKTSPDSGGRPFRSFIPPAIVMESSETEMQMTLKPMPHQRPQPISDGRGGMKQVGSVFQVMGADKDSMENMRGMNAVYAVFSEYADQNQAAWETIIEPMMMENHGIAAFNFTPKGKNHAFTLWNYALQSPEWFTSLRTVEETRRDAEGEDGSRIVTVEQIDGLRARGVAEEIIQQEYFCSFDGYLHGTVYGDLVRRAESEGRITRVPCLANQPVGTLWDLGKADGTAIWFYQVVGSEIRFIDYYANRGQAIQHYIKVCQERPYVYGKIVLPHDGLHENLNTQESIRDVLSRSLCRNITVVKRTASVQLDIDVVRPYWSRFVFDRHHCDQPPNPGLPSGLDSLRGYRRKWDEEKNDYSGDVVHDQYSHAADALRIGMVGWEEGLHFVGEEWQTEMKVEMEFDPRAAFAGPRRGF
jgi:hypothetical protein